MSPTIQHKYIHYLTFLAILSFWEPLPCGRCIFVGYSNNRPRRCSMKSSSHLGCFFVLLLLAACAKTGQPLGEPETPSAPATDLADSRIDVSSLSGRIVYSSEGDVFVINADGTGR